MSCAGLLCSVGIFCDRVFCVSEFGNIYDHLWTQHMIYLKIESGFLVGIMFFNFKDVFKKQILNCFVLGPKKDSIYTPCLDCNCFINFNKFLHCTQELGFEYILIGCYTSIEYKDRWYLLKKALDQIKDQSYVLYAMTQSNLRITFSCWITRTKLKFARLPHNKVLRMQLKKIAGYLFCARCWLCYGDTMVERKGIFFR